jgi:hypothetical protein
MVACIFLCIEESNMLHSRPLVLHLHELGKTCMASRKGVATTRITKLGALACVPLILSYLVFNSIGYQLIHVHGKTKPALSKDWAGELHD